MPYDGEKINRPKLIQLMEDHSVDSLDVGKILNRKPTTVETWRSISGVDIPDHTLELLTLKLSNATS